VSAERWRVVAALFVVTACVSTSVSAFGVFLPVLSETFGWSRGAVSVALAINLIWGGLVAFLVGGIADRRGPRGALTGTVLVGALGFALTAAITALWHLYLTYGLLVGVGMSSIYILSATTVSRWFPERRGVALALVLSGFNAGWLLGGPAAAVLIGRWGWRGAYLGLAALLLAVAAPASLLVSDPPAAPAADRPLPPRPRTREVLGRAAGDPRLWLLVAAWFLLGLVFVTVSVHSVSYALGRGLPLGQASLALTGFGVGAAIGRLAAGAAADRLGTATTMRWCAVLQAGALVALLAGPPPWAVAPTLVLFGIGASGADNTFVKGVPEVFGVAGLASTMSLMGLGWRVGAGLGPAVAGFLYDLTRSYTPTFALTLAAVAAGWGLWGLAWRVHGRRGRPGAGGSGVLD
jgi:MFS family permease